MAGLDEGDPEGGGGGRGREAPWSTSSAVWPNLVGTAGDLGGSLGGREEEKEGGRDGGREGQREGTKE